MAWQVHTISWATAKTGKTEIQILINCVLILVSITELNTICLFITDPVTEYQMERHYLVTNSWLGYWVLIQLLITIQLRNQVLINQLPIQLPNTDLVTKCHFMTIYQV